MSRPEGGALPTPDQHFFEKRYDQALIRIEELEEEIDELKRLLYGSA